jgi:glycosyltransferase involved in cell wall biosynthesis
VVASHVGGIPEVVPGYAGILVPPHAPQALSAALLEATEKSWDSTRIATHADDFRWEDNVIQLERILQEVVAATPVFSGASA